MKTNHANIVILGLQQLFLATTVLAGDIFPDRLHCSTALYIPESDGQDVNFFRVDEYVDLKGGKSSCRVDNIRPDDEKIYYNQIGTDESCSSRQFIQFDRLRASCQSQELTHFPFSILRRIALLMYPTENSPLNSCNRPVDVPTGPSILLYAIENSLQSFLYKATKYSGSRLTFVDFYERRISLENSSEDFSEIDIRIEIISRGRTVDASDKISGKSRLANEKINMVAMTACRADKAGKSDNDDDINIYADDTTAEFKPKSENLHDDSVPTLLCDLDRLIFQVKFNLISEYLPGSQLGNEIYEQTEYNFNREPFSRPIGIGCWSTGSDYDWQKTFTIPTKLFSAEYKTNNGTKSASYVAYDGYRELLRLDRNGRKSIYDLLSGYSYHIGEFSSTRDIKMDEASAQANLSNEKCVVFKTSDTSLNPGMAMLRVLGLGQDTKTAHLGSKLIDHVVYEVFETELVFLPNVGYNLPILLQPMRFSAPTSPLQSKSYFITYYVHEYPDIELNVRSQDGLQILKSTVMLPKFIEVWEFTESTKKRKLINRLIFTQFSWTLDVEPSNDPDTQRDLSNLFNIEQCHQTRSTQGELDFVITKFSSTDSVEGIKSNLPLVKEILHEKLTTILGISRLNIDNLNVQLTSSGDLAVKSRIVELVTGFDYEIPLGTVKFYSDTLNDCIHKVYFNRHSIDDCKLDSISFWRSNWFAYCPSLTICVIVDQNYDLGSKLKSDSENSDESNKISSDSANQLDRDDDLCYVRSFSWSQIYKQQGLDIFKQVESMKFKLSGTRFNFPYRYFNEESNKWVVSEYSGYGLKSYLKQLDSVGHKASLTTNSLAGLSYTTTKEEPKTFNYNERVTLTKDLDTFKMCQLACQMDDLCGSFSVCLRSKNLNNDCIITTIRLTAKRLERLVSLASNSREKGTHSFKVKVSGERQTQLFILKRDSECTIHPKDFLSEYRSSYDFLPETDSAKHIEGLKNMNNDDQKSDNLATSSKTKPRDGQLYCSLEDCAGLSFERNLFAESSKETAFTYCPLEASCITSGDKNDLHEQISKTSSSKMCTIYERNFLRYYRSWSMNHMIVSGENPSKQTSEIPSNQLRLLPKDVAREWESNKFARLVWGLREQDCARECNLYNSKCLAFDVCRQDGRNLCILFAIRSPMARVTPTLRLLPLEQRLKSMAGVSAGNGAILAVNLNCNHYWLLEAYFEVKLRQLLLESKADDSSSETTTAKTSIDGKTNYDESNQLKRDDLIAAFEKPILEADKKLSESEFSEIIEEKSVQLEKINLQLLNHSYGGIHITMLSIGFLSGCLVILFKQQLANQATRLYSNHATLLSPRFWPRHETNVNEGLTHLVLAENM